MRFTFPRLAAATLIISTLLVPARLAAQRPDHARLLATIDSIVSAPIKAGQLAGSSIAVVKGRDTIVVKGYGWADLDLDVPTPANAIYEIGSITKQFTSAAIMQLVEQGKVTLDDDLLTYLPAYPSRGQHVTIRRLLDHTSGIRSYTDIPEVGPIIGLTLPPDSIMAFFARSGFDYSPGEALIYNNSGFFLLGMILEKVTGKRYAELVKTNLFDRVGMSRAAYCSESTITKGKVHGYAFAGTLRKADQQNHSWPYAAGSLCMSALDVMSWLRALHTTDQVVTRASYREMITPGTLSDGYKVRYAKGLTNLVEDGRQVIGHSGGISGFSTESRYYPADSLYIVVLNNSTGAGSPTGIAQAIAKAVLGPGTPLAAAPLSGDLAMFTGRYRGPGRGAPTDIRFTVQNGALVLASNTARPLLYLGKDTFGVGNTRYVFMRDAAGAVNAVRVDNVSVVAIARREATP